MKTEEIKEEARKWIEENGEKGSSDMLIELTSKAKDKEFLEFLKTPEVKDMETESEVYEYIANKINKKIEELKQKLEEK